jgi:KaiC/GvpD/RAD55 family RecA-like ATPase
MPVEKPRSIPTGITSLDEAMDGGFPAGVLVELTGEMGAGHKELAATTAMMLSAMKSGKLRRPKGENIMIPKRILWVTFTRPETDIIREIESSYDPDLYKPFRKQVKFKDLSEDYFLTSSVPIEWISKGAVRKRRKAALTGLRDELAGLRRRAGAPARKPKGILDSLANYLTGRAKDSLVVLDSLTDLARLYSDTEERWYEFVLFLRGLQRVSKRWNGVIYGIHDANLLDKRMEAELAVCADGVLSFRWAQAGPAERRRTLYLRKFRGLLPSAGGAAMRFEVTISPSSGLQVIKPELIEGLKV